MLDPYSWETNRAFHVGKVFVCSTPRPPPPAGTSPKRRHGKIVVKTAGCTDRGTTQWAVIFTIFTAVRPNLGRYWKTCSGRKTLLFIWRNQLRIKMAQLQPPLNHSTKTQKHGTHNADIGTYALQTTMTGRGKKSEKEPRGTKKTRRHQVWKTIFFVAKEEEPRSQSQSSLPPSLFHPPPSLSAHGHGGGGKQSRNIAKRNIRPRTSRPSFCGIWLFDHVEREQGNFCDWMMILKTRNRGGEGKKAKPPHSWVPLSDPTPGLSQGLSQGATRDKTTL